MTLEDNGCVSTLNPSIFGHWVRTEKGEVTEDHPPTPQEIAEHLQPVDPLKIEALIAAGFPSEGS